MMMQPMNPLQLVELQGQIIRKKKREKWLVLAVKYDSNEPTMNVHLSREKGATIDGQPLHACEDDFQDLLFLRATILVKGFFQEASPVHLNRGMDVSRGGLFVDQIHLIQCAADPLAVQVVLKSLAQQDDRFEPSALLMSEQSPREEAERILGLKPRPRRLAIARLVRKLQGLKCLERGPRIRLPYTKKTDLEILDHVESTGKCPEAPWKLMEPVPSHPKATQTSSSLPLNLPGLQDPNITDTSALDSIHSSESDMVSDLGYQNRVEYLTVKKHPQVQWMTRRVRELLSSRDDGTITHVLDVGGGRGDLATALAMALPESLVTVVDKNEPSLEAGRAFAQQLGLARRMYFVQADFRSFTRNPSSFYEIESSNVDGETQRESPPPINLVVALHACGDLSDLALSYAQELSCPFLVCPCCYTKRYIVDDFRPPWWRYLDQYGQETDDRKNDNGDLPHAASRLGRFAEINELPELSRRSMTVINSMRLSCMASNYCVSLEEFDNTSSMRNLVLVGVTP